MAIVSVTELIEGRESTRGTEGKRTYSRSFHVLTDDKDDGPRTVRTAAGIPNMYAPYSVGNDTDLGALVISKNVSPVEGQTKLWRVEVEYSSELPEQTEEEEDDENPLNQPARWQWGFRTVQRVVREDLNGDLIANKAGQVFDPPLQVEEYRPVLTVTRNEASFNIALASDYVGAINSDNFLGVAPKYARLTNLGASSAKADSGGTYVEVNYEIEFARDPWNPVKLPNIGFMELDDDGNLVNARDNDEEFANEPVKLDADGKRLADGAKAIPVEFDIYPERPFAVLNLV